MRPAEVQGIDLAVGQVTYAHHRLPAGPAIFCVAMSWRCRYHDAVFDLAVMALVLFFLADPAKGIAEMKRVVRPRGVVASYAWDVLGGGFPADPVLVEMCAKGLAPSTATPCKCSGAPRVHSVLGGSGAPGHRNARRDGRAHVQAISPSSGPRAC